MLQWWIEHWYIISNYSRNYQGPLAIILTSRFKFLVAIVSVRSITHSDLKITPLRETFFRFKFIFLSFSKELLFLFYYLPVFGVQFFSCFAVLHAECSKPSDERMNLLILNHSYPSCHFTDWFHVHPFANCFRPLMKGCFRSRVAEI